MRARTLWVLGLGLLALGAAVAAPFALDAWPSVGLLGRSTPEDGLSRLRVVDRVAGLQLADATWTLIARRSGFAQERSGFAGRSGIARRGGERDAEGAKQGAAAEDGYDEGFEHGVLPTLPSAEGMRRAARIAVGAFGYEVRILDVLELTTAQGHVALDPVTDLATLRLETDDDGLLDTPVQVSMTLRDPGAPASAVSVWWLHRELRLSRSGLTIPVGKGHRVIAYAMSASGPYVTWPFPAVVSPGRPTTLHLERARSIGHGPGRPASGGGGYGWLHLDPRHVATLSDEQRSGLSLHGGLGGYESTPSTAGPVFRSVPRFPLTGLVHEHGAWRTVELDAQTTTLDPPKGRPPQRWLRTISIDGEAPPEGTLVLPGTLADDLVNAVLARGWFDIDGLGVRLPAPADFAGALLPTADTLTVWHGARGLARLVWSPDGTAIGAWMPGCVRVSARPGRAERIACSVRSGCVGSPNVQSGALRADGMERAVAPHGDTLLRGIPLGPVAIEIRVWLRGQPEPEFLQRRVALGVAAPCVRFSITDDGTVWFDGTGAEEAPPK